MGKKTFATFHAGGYDEGRRAGWVAVRLEGEVNWAEIRELLVQGYRLDAPKRALARVDE